MRPTTSEKETEQELQGGGNLCIELDVGGAEADEAGEEGLVQVAVLLEGHVFNHRRQLVVVPYEDDSLQPAVPILLSLQAGTYTLVHDVFGNNNNIYVMILLSVERLNTCTGSSGLGVPHSPAVLNPRQVL